MVRFIVTDIDGTVVPDGKGAESLNLEYYEVIRELLSYGVIFSCASGRQYSSIRRLFRPVHDRLLYITEGGGLVFGQGEILYSKPLNRKVILEIIQDIRKIEDCDAMVCGIKQVYVEKEDSKLYRWMKDSYKYDIQAVGDLTNPIEDEIVKISLFHRYDLAEETARKWFIPKWEKKLQVSVAGAQWIDLVVRDTNKGAAVKFLQDKYKVSKEETVVFGDNQNDISMFEAAEKSYAVENAAEQVKSRATSVCGGYETDGVLMKLKEILRTYKNEGDKTHE